MSQSNQSNSHEADTKQRILEVAIELFSRKGYRSTSVASICEEAHVNVAAVNYHFRSKLDLYLHVWKTALEREADSNPLDSMSLERASVEDRLKARVRSLIYRFVRPGAPSQVAMLIIHELADPTDPAVDEIRFNAIQPPHRAMRELVCEMLGEGATDQEILFTTMGIFTPVFGLGLQQQSVYRRDHRLSDYENPMRPKLPGEIMREAIEREGGFETLINHICMTTLAGINAVRFNIENRGTL